VPFPFDRTYMQLALAVGLCVGAAAPLIGAFLVQKRLSLLGDGIAHAAFAGVTIGLLLHIAPVWTAMVVAGAGAVAIEWLRARGHAGGDLALALLLYSGLATGVVLSSAAGSFDASVLSYLFGSVLTITRGDAVTVASMAIVVVLVVALLWRALFAVIIDPESAKVAGLPVDALNVGLSLLAAVTVVVAMRVVGALLIAGLMVLPVGGAQLLARSFRGMLVVSAVIGMASVAVGLAAARVWGLAPGGTIVLVSAAVFVLASIRRGALPVLRSLGSV
jgi:zinc transport system permease protein